MHRHTHTHINWITTFFLFFGRGTNNTLNGPPYSSLFFLFEYYAYYSMLTVPSFHDIDST